jgi:hypothetical protein
MKNCTQCQSSFEVTESDRKLIEAVSPVIAGQKYLIPDPTLCPDCRMQRRMTFRNERKLYRSKSALSGKSMVSLYSPKGEHPAYTVRISIFLAHSSSNLGNCWPKYPR